MPYLQLVRLTWHLLSDGGFYVFLGGVALVVAAFLPPPLRPEAAPGALSGLGVGLVGLGFGMGLLAVWLERRTVAELEREHAAHGTTTPPGPWIADGVWQQWTRFDGYRALWEGPRPIVPLVDRVQVHEVTLDEFQAAARVRPEPRDPLPPSGELEQHAARLAGCHGPRTLEGVRWPVCCQRLTVLVLAGDDDPAWPPAEGPVRLQLVGSDDTAVVLGAGEVRVVSLVDPGPDQPVSRDRVVGFHCRACGRLYADLLPVQLR